MMTPTNSQVTTIERTVHVWEIPETEEELPGWGFYAGYPGQPREAMLLIRKFTEWGEFQRAAQSLYCGQLKANELIAAIP